MPYAVVKNIGEVYLRTYQREFGLDYIIFRLFNTYGPNQSEDFVLPRFVRAAMKGQPLTVYGDGSQTRTFCYVDDNVDACLAAHYSGQFVNDTVNIGGADEISMRALAELVVDVVGSRSELVNLPALPEGDMTRRRPDVRKMRKLLDREPVELEEGIRRLVAHYQAAGPGS